MLLVTLVDLSKLPINRQIQCILLIEKELLENESLTHHNIDIIAAPIAFEIADLHPVPTTTTTTTPHK